MAQLGSLDMTIAFPVQIAMEFRGKHRFTIDIDNGGVSSNGTRNWVKAEMLTGWLWRGCFLAQRHTSIPTIKSWSENTSKFLTPG